MSLRQERAPRQYFLKYVERVRPDFRTTALAFGTAWHDATREYFASRGALSLDELAAVFANSFDEQLEADDVPVLFEADEARDDLVAKARLMLLAFGKRVPAPEEVLDLSAHSRSSSSVPPRESLSQPLWSGPSTPSSEGTQRSSCSS